MTPDSPERVAYDIIASDDWITPGEFGEDRYDFRKLEKLFASALLKAREEGRAEERERSKGLVEFVRDIPALLEASHKAGESVADVHDCFVRWVSDKLIAYRQSEAETKERA